MRSSLLFALGAGAAATSLLSTLPWIGTRSRAWMLGPHLATPPSLRPRPAVGNRAGHEIVTMAGRAAARLTTGLLGAFEPLSVRLARVHHRDDPGAFRFRQGAGALGAAVLAIAVAAGSVLPPAVGVLVVVALPIGAAIAPEIELARQGRRWSEAVRAQMPVVGEQLVALLGSGRSPTGALDHVADDAGTPLQRDIARVVDHIRRGGSLDDALRQWSAVSDVDSAHRLAAVMGLHHRTPDLAELVQREVAAVRDDLHRDLLAGIDRRGQQVWIPVTIAALIPGSIFLLVPFFDALRLFGATA